MKRRSKILLLLVVSVWLCALENYSQNRNHERVLFNKALYRYEGGDYKASFKRFEELTKLNPNDCEYFLFAGLSLMNSSDSVSHALKWFDKGLQCDSAIGTTPETRDDLLLAKGEVLRALIRLALQVDGHNVEPPGLLNHLKCRVLLDVFDVVSECDVAAVQLNDVYELKPFIS